ncbi:MAG: helix-turn-helix domain-containing protein [Eubacterium sp.]
MNINNDKRFMTVSEVADLFGCNIHQIYKVINSGELRSIKLGRIMIATEWLEEFINNQANQCNADERGVQ